MSVLDQLIDGATSDTEVLQSLVEQGDDLTQFRDVTFLLLSPDQEKADLVAGFINDLQYGAATAANGEDGHCVEVVIYMPITQNLILSVSGFMECVAAMYGLEYDGWACTPQLPN